MSYQICRYTREALERELSRALRVKCEESLVVGWISRQTALETIRYYALISEGWNEKLNRPATNYTPTDQLGVRYHIYSVEKQDIIYNPLTKEEALAICEKILNSMVKKGLVTISKSGKGVKYIGPTTK